MRRITERPPRLDAARAAPRPTEQQARLDVPAWLPVVTFAIAALVFTAPALASGGVMAATDILLGHAPYDSYLAEPVPHRNSLQLDQVEQLPFVLEFYEGLRDGSVQLWEPDVGGGVPLFPAVYNRLLAPWNVVQLVVPGGVGVTLGLTLALFGCQFATYGLARRLGLGRLPATLAGVGYAFSGPVTAFLLRIHEVLIAPLLFYALHGAVVERRARWVVLTSVATALTLLGGFPAAAVMALYAAAAWLVWLVVTETPPLRHSGARVRSAVGRAWPAVGAVAAGGAVAAVQILPSLSFLSVTGSLERSYPIWHRAGLEKLATAVAGRFFGAFQNQNWWWPGRAYANPVEASSTVGLVALALIGLVAVRGAAPGSMASRPVSRFFLPLGLVVLVGVFLGGPVLGVLHQLPFLSGNSFGRSRFLLALALALAAGLGLERLLERGTAKGGARDLWLCGQLAAVLGVVALAVYDAGTIAARQSALRYVAFALGPPILGLVVGIVLVRVLRSRPLVVGLGLAILLGAELQFGSWGFTPSSPPASVYPDVPAFEVVEDDVGPGGQYRLFSPNFRNLRPNAAAVHDLRDIRVAWPSYRPYRELLLAADPKVFRSRLKSYFTDALDPRSPILDRLSVRYLAEAHDQPLLEVGEPLRASVEAGRLPLDFPGPADSIPVRGLTVHLELDDPSCDRGWVQLSKDAITSRRLLREAGRRTVFPLPDVAAHGTWTLTSTDCPARVVSSRASWSPVDDGAALEVVSVEGWTVYARPSALPRASLAEEVEAATSRAPQRLASGLPSGTVLAGGDLRPGLRGPGTADLLRDDPDVVEVAVEVDGGTGDSGLLVLRDVAAPGWQATVDGRPATVHHVDHAFRGVEVPTGHSVVRFTYAPPALRLGTILAVAGLLMTVVLAVLVRRGRHPAGQSQPRSRPAA